MYGKLEYYSDKFIKLNTQLAREKLVPQLERRYKQPQHMQNYE